MTSIAIAARLLPALILTTAIPAASQTQNKAETGSGGVLETMETIQGEYDKYWSGRPGQYAKGAIGAAAIARALGAARDALSFEGAVNRNLQSTPASTSSTSSSSSPTTTTGTTSSTATN